MNRFLMAILGLMIASPAMSADLTPSFPSGGINPSNGIYGGMITGLTITEPGAYAPSDLPVKLSIDGNRSGERASASVTAYTAVSARVASAGSGCPAGSIYSYGATGTKIIVSDGNGLSGSTVSVVSGGTGNASAIPANPVSMTTAKSSCAPPKLNLSWGVQSVSLDNQGWGYASPPSGTGSVSMAPDAAIALVGTTVQTGVVSLPDKLVAASKVGTAGGVAALDNNGRVIAPVVGDVSGATATSDGKTVSQIGQMANGSVQKSDIGATVAGLNAGSLLPGTGADNATVNSVPLREAVNSCRQRDHDVFIYAHNTTTALSNPVNTKNFNGTGRGGLYLSLAGLYKMTAGSEDALNPAGSVSLGKQIVGNFSGQGIGEEFYDTYGTPNVPSASHNDGNAFSNMNGPALASSIGWAPSIMLMNINTTASGTEASISAQNLSDYNTAVNDIKSGYPSVKYVYPYYRSDSKVSDWSNPSDALKSAQSMILTSGGVGLDYPVGWLLANPTRLANAVAEIQWANSHGVVTIFYLTPFSSSTATDANGKAIPQQFIYDPDFVKNIRKVISLLAAQNALPSAWVVGNYSPINTGSDGSIITSNQIGTDTDISSASIASAATWVAEYAPTSSYVSLPLDSQGGGDVPCAQYVRGGVLSKAANMTIAANMLPPGSLGYQDQSDALLGKLTTTGDERIGGQLYVAGGPVLVSNSFVGINYPTNSLVDIRSARSGNVLSWNYSSGNGETELINIRPNTATTGGIYLYDLITGEKPNSTTMLAEFLRTGAIFNTPVSANNGLTTHNFTITGTTAGFEVGDQTTNISFTDYHSSVSDNDYDVRIQATGGVNGTIGQGTLTFLAANVKYGGAQQLFSTTRSRILAIASPQEGMILNDSDDHVPVIYENGKWYPLQLGAALSN